MVAMMTSPLQLCLGLVIYYKWTFVNSCFLICSHVKSCNGQPGHSTLPIYWLLIFPWTYTLGCCSCRKKWQVIYSACANHRLLSLKVIRKWLGISPIKWVGSWLEVWPLKIHPPQISTWIHRCWDARCDTVEIKKLRSWLLELELD